MDFGDAREIIADYLYRISAAQGQMSGVRGDPDVFGIGEVHDPAHVFFGGVGSRRQKLHRDCRGAAGSVEQKAAWKWTPSQNGEVTGGEAMLEGEGRSFSVIADQTQG